MNVSASALSKYLKQKEVIQKATSRVRTISIYFIAARETAWLKYITDWCFFLPLNNFCFPRVVARDEFNTAFKNDNKILISNFLISLD